MKNQKIIFLGDAQGLEEPQEQDVSEPQGQVSSIYNSKKKPHVRYSSQQISSSTVIYIATLMVVILIVQIAAAYFQANKKIGTVEIVLKKQQIKKRQLDFKAKGFQEQINKVKHQISILKDQKEIKNVDSATSNPKVQKSQNLKEELNLNQSQLFKIPKYVWVYLPRGLESENLITKLGFENIKYYASKSGFEMRVVDRENFKNWLNQAQTSELEGYIRRIEGQESIRNDLEHIRMLTIMLFLIREHGGVMVSYKLILTEPLNWIRSIHRAVHVNIGNKNVKPQYFAFFNMDAGPRWDKKNRDVQFEVEKLVYIFPGITDVFLAGVEKGEFLKAMYQHFIGLVDSDFQKRNALISQLGLERGNLNVQNVYHLYSFAAHITIQSKQKQLEPQNEKNYKFAIDHYGLITMNENYAPQKMHVLFKNRLNTRNYFDNFYNYLARLPQNEFEEVIGPLRYAIFPDPYNNQFNNRLEKQMNNQGHEVWEGSFIHKNLFLGKSVNTKPNKEKPAVPKSFTKWQTLPKKLWLFWDKGLDNASAGNQLCAMNIIKNAELAGFEVFKVDDNNIKDYLPEGELNKIAETIKNAKFPLPAQIRSDFIRLALIAHHGGVYMDVSYVWFESFQWFINVAREPTHYIFNRFGDHPKVLFQFHTLQGAPFEWEVDEQSNTKASWHLAYENNLIIAEKDNQFIKQWYNLFQIFTISQFDSVQKKLNECNTNSHRWTQPHDRYLTAMDALKAVIGCRQIQIQSNPQKYPNIKNAADYYKIWSFNGFNGLQKFRYYNDYTFSFNGAIDNEPHAVYKSSIDFNDATIGKVYKGIKLYSWNIHFLSIYLEHNYGNNFETESHPHSYFHKYMFNKATHEFYRTDKLHVKKKQ